MAKSKTVFATMALSVVFFLSGIFVLAYFNLQTMADRWKEDIEIRIFLRGEVSEESVTGLRDKLIHWTEVEGVRWISRDEALTSLAGRPGWQRERVSLDRLTSDLGGSPLPHSLELTLRPPYRNAVGIEGIMPRLAGDPRVDEVQYDREGVRALDRFDGWIRKAGIWGGGLLLGVLALAVYASMRLLAAAPYETDEAVEGRPKGLPLAVRGGWTGLWAAGISLGLLAACYVAAAGKLPLGSIEGLSGLNPVFFSWPVMGLWLVSGGMLCGITAWVASLSGR